MNGLSHSNVAIVLSILVIVGCAVDGQPKPTVDRALVRHSDAGREAYIEGDISEAVKKFDRALMRAWATDDPYESGTVAYNLAACRVSEQKYAEASDWLVDARVELCRAGSSTGNAWLLSSEIAMAEERFGDASQYVDYAARACAPCEIEPDGCLCGPGSSCGAGSSCGQDCPEADACRECCLVKLPCVGDKIRQANATEDCEQTYQARIHLTRAKLAAKQGDLVCAKTQLAQACEYSMEVCDPLLHADRHDVAALIHESEERWLQAGAHLDREIELLRCVGHFRKIPDLLDAAALNYEYAGRFDLAVDRLVRSARVWLARGDANRAWHRVRRGGELSPSGCIGGQACRAVEVRLALTARKIEETIGDDAESSLSLKMPLARPPAAHPSLALPSLAPPSMTATPISAEADTAPLQEPSDVISDLPDHLTSFEDRLSQLLIPFPTDPTSFE